VAKRVSDLEGGAAVDYKFLGAAALHGFCEGCGFLPSLLFVMLRPKALTHEGGRHKVCAKIKKGENMFPAKASGMHMLLRSALALGAVLMCMATRISAQSAANGAEWPTYGGDLANTRYRPLDQINAANFSKLQIAWRFKTDSLGPRHEFKLEGTPLMVKGVLYTTAGSRRAVVALDAGTGELLWMHSEQEGERGTN